MKNVGISIAAVTAIATAGAIALFKLTSSFAKQGDQLAKTSKSIGVGVIQLQKWQFAVERSGGDGEKFVKSLIKMRIELERVALGETAESASAFERLGINIRDLTTNAILPLEELLPLLADKIAALTNEQEKASIAALIFGTRMGPQLVPFLNEGAAGIKRLGEEAAKYGLISEESAKLSEEFVDAQRNLSQSMTSLKSIIAVELMPQITVMLQGLADWISENDELIGQDIEGFLEDTVTAARKVIPVISAIAEAVGFIAGFIDKANKLAVGGGFSFTAPEVGLLNIALDKIKEHVIGDSLGDIEIAAALAALQTNKFRQELIELNSVMGPQLPGKINKVEGAFIPLTKGISSADKALKDFEAAQESFTQSIEDQIATVQKQIDTFGFTNAQLIEYETNVLLGDRATEKFNETLDKEIKQLGGVRLALDKLEKARERDAKLLEIQQEAADEFLEAQAQAIEDSLQGIQIFTAAVAANINTAFADTLTELVFDFENFGDAIKNVFKSILNAFFQMIFTMATNPIRIALQASLSGGGGGGGANIAAGAGSILGGLGGLGASFGALGSLFGIGGGVAAIGGAGSIVGSLTGGAVASVGAVVPAGIGIFATLGAALPAIGIVLAAIAIAIPLIMNFIKKTPKIDIDIGVLKREIDGEIVKRGANVQEFLDALDAPNSDLAKEIIRFSTVQGRVGLKGKAREDVRLAILTVIGGSIEAIQSILAKLPQEMFLALSESLLAAEIDIEDFKGGDKLLEFDKKGKKVMQDLMDFIAGTLPARFFASLSESFFVPMLETLGVTAEGAQKLMDDFVDSLKGASPEQAKQLGEEFLATIDAYVDVFNLLNEGMKGVMGKALDDITALAASLDIESATGIPTLREIEAALQDLFETGKLTGELAQDFLALRAAVISLTVGLARSVSNITAIIAQLDADIVGLGGSAIGTSDGVREAIDSLQNLLDNEGLSLDEREAILNELNSLADQLGSQELANQQQAIQGNINAANSQIQNLQLLKTVEADKHQAALNALNEELSLAEALESFLEGIRRNISSLLLATGGPESVSERIARARGEVTGLFGQLASASPEEQLGIASQIQDLLNELNTLRQEAFQAPSAESDDLFREIVLNLEKLEGLLEPARSSEEIQASIETIELASQALLSNIDSQIGSFQSQLAGLQATGNQLTGMVADEVRALKESIRAEFVLILEERLEQLGEITGTGIEAVVAIEQEALIVLRDNGATLEAIATFTKQMAAQVVGGGILIPNNIPIPGFAHGGFVPPGKNILATLHGGSQGEDIVPRNGNSVQGGDVYLTLPPMTFSASQVVNPDMFMKELFKSLHNPIVTREIEKIRGRK